MHFRRTAILIGAVLTVHIAKAQAPKAVSGHLSFAVATIKPSKASIWKLQPTSAGYTAIGASLRELVREAYGVYDEKLHRGGPPWVDSDRFDLEAKVDGNEIPQFSKLSFRQRADMLRPLLADRFGLQVHFESKPFPVYDLIVAKGGPRLQPTRAAISNEEGMPTASCYVLQNRAGYTQRQDCTVESLNQLLHEATGRSVLDKTGLTGRYDFELRWAPQNVSPNDVSNESLADIFTAVREQLGLKLEPANAPLDVLIIDHVERPSAN